MSIERWGMYGKRNWAKGERGMGGEKGGQMNYGGFMGRKCAQKANGVLLTITGLGLSFFILKQTWQRTQRRRSFHPPEADRGGSDLSGQRGNRESNALRW